MDIEDTNIEDSDHTVYTVFIQSGLVFLLILTYPLWKQLLILFTMWLAGVL